MINTVVIVGPTASGKTSLSIELAKKYGFEIICADSMQIYSQLSISTARPTKDEQSNIPHHLFGSVSVEEEYSVAEYCQNAIRKAKEIDSQNKRVMFCGGTGLYIDSLVNGIDFSSTDSDEKVRTRLEEESRLYGTEYLHDKLKSVDPVSAEKIHPNNVKRVIRALEIFEVCGKPKSVIDIESRETPSEINALYIGVNYKNRQTLYERVEKRVDLMIENGLIDEVREFYKLNPCKTASAAIGCKEIKPYLDGVKSLDECVEELKTATRRYAKRQLTWFCRNDKINWVYPDEQEFDECVEIASQLIENFYGGKS